MVSRTIAEIFGIRYDERQNTILKNDGCSFIVVCTRTRRHDSKIYSSDVCDKLKYAQGLHVRKENKE